MLAMDKVNDIRNQFFVKGENISQIADRGVANISDKTHAKTIISEKLAISHMLSL